MARATTIRFSDEVYARLDQASAQSGMPVNSIVIAACLEWMQRHALAPTEPGESAGQLPILVPRPRWATLRRAVKLAVGERTALQSYPFGRFTSTAQNMLTAAQAEAERGGHTYIGTEHLLFAAFADPTSHAAQILARLNVKEIAVRSSIKQLQVGAPPGGQRIMPTARVKKVIEIAFQLSGTAADTSVNTGHILAALAAEGDGIAAHVLKDMGVKSRQIERAIEALTEPEP